MTLQEQTAQQVLNAVKAAGLEVRATEAGKDFSGGATTRFSLGRQGGAGATQVLELSDGLDLAQPSLAGQIKTYFEEAAMRLRNPRPDCMLTLKGMPLSFGKFAWPFHGSTSGADTYVLHGEIRLEDGSAESVLHAKIAAALTVTFREIVESMEQPFAEGFIYNAIRKTMDQGQLELVKSGNRQPVPVTTRYYSMRKREFVFNDTTEAERHEFLTAKTLWLSGVLGGGEPVWLADPRDAQYLNTTVAELQKTGEALASDGLVALSADRQFGSPTPALMSRRAQYEAEVAQLLQAIKPSFNEEMRSGHTNM